MKEDEFIYRAAIKYKDRLYCGFDHGECFKQIDDDNIDANNISEGFVTQYSRFVDRKEAMKIAKKAKQIAYETNKKTLISEDIHLDWLHRLSSKVMATNLLYASRHDDYPNCMGAERGMPLCVKQKSEIAKLKKANQELQQQYDDIYSSYYDIFEDKADEAELSRTKHELNMYKGDIQLMEQMIESLYTALYDTLEKQNIDNVSSVIEQLTTMNFHKYSYNYKSRKMSDQIEDCKALVSLQRVKEKLLQICSASISKTYCGIDEDIKEIIDEEMDYIKTNEVNNEEKG